MRANQATAAGSSFFYVILNCAYMSLKILYNQVKHGDTNASYGLPAMNLGLGASFMTEYVSNL